MAETNTNKKWLLLRDWLEKAVSRQQEAVDDEIIEHPGSEDMLLYATARESYRDVLRVMDSLDR